MINHLLFKNIEVLGLIVKVNVELFGENNIGYWNGICELTIILSFRDLLEQDVIFDIFRVIGDYGYDASSFTGVFAPVVPG